MPIKRIPIQERSEKKQTVMLITNHNCNIRCLYCYEPPGLIKSKNLDFEIARDTITKYMESDNGFDNIEFQFFGGECMLSFPLIKRIVDWFHNRDWKKGHVFFICTNGTILTDEMKKWLVKNKQCVVLGFSLDGSRTAHNIGRDNSYDRLKKNIPFFLEHWPTQPAKMTIYAETIPYLADSIIEMEEMGLNFEANTVFEDIWGEGEQKAALLECYREQLDILVEFYIDRPDLEPVAPLLNRDLGFVSRPGELIDTGDNCLRFCGAGHAMVMVDVDGKSYPCHRFAPWVTRRPAPMVPVNLQTKWRPHECAECTLVALCPTCAGFNWEINGNTGMRTTFHCEAFKLELMASAKLLALKLGQMPIPDLNDLRGEEAFVLKHRLDSILQLDDIGV